MTIERRIRITALVLILYAMGLALALYWSSYQVGLGLAGIETTSKIDRYALMLRVLMRDYQEQGSEQILRQWEHQNVALGQMLNDGKLSKTLDAGLLEEVRKRYQAVNLLSPRLREMKASTETGDRSQNVTGMKMLTALMFPQLEQLVHATDDLRMATQTLTLKKQGFIGHLIVALGISAVIVIILNTYLIRKSVVSPLQTLSKEAERVGSGNFDPIPQPGSDDEVGKLTQAFNAMIAGIENQTTALKNAQRELELRMEERTAAYEAARTQNELLEAVHRAQTQFISHLSPENIFENLLHDLLALTNSEFGFIGETFYTEEGQIYLKDKAITDISWNEETRKTYQKFADERGLDFSHVRGLWGHAIRTGKPVISNGPANDPRSGGLPEGHPSFTSFLGLPFHSDGKVIGMAGIANRPGGYTQELADFLLPYVATCAAVIDGYRTENHRREAEARLFETNQRLQALMQAAPVGISFSEDVTCLRITGNPAVMAQFEVSPDDNLSASAASGEEAGRKVRYFQAGREVEGSELPLQRAVAEGRIIAPMELEIHLPSGRRWFAEASGAPVRDEQGNVVGGLAVTVDITERKRAGQEQEIVLEFLRLVNESTGTADLIRAVATFFQKRLGCDAVGIRLREGNDYPYFEARGFSEEFTLLENRLCDYDEHGRESVDSVGNPVLECMCGNVISGRFDPSKPFFTERGSFWTNCMTELLASTTDEARQARTLNRCNGEGYESVALIALRSGDEQWGLLQLSDKRRGRFTLNTIALGERLAQHLSEALAKFEAQEALREAKEHLEIRVLERTEELEAANRSLQEEMAERRRAEDALSVERQRLYDILETMPVMVCLLTPDYHVAFANRAFRDKFGEDKGLHCYEYVFGQESPCKFCQTYDVLKTGKPHHWECTGLDGSLIDVHAIPFTDIDGSQLILELNVDITEQRHANDTVKAERKRLNDVLNVLPAYVILLTTDYHVPFANSFFEERFGKSHGKRCFEYLFGLTEPCETCETFTVLKTNAPHRWEWTGPDGRNYDIYDFPFIDTDGSRLIMEVGLDITEQKRAEAERENLIGELEAKNAELERFTYSVSHDLKSPLVTIMSFLGFIEEDAVKGNIDNLRMDVERISRAATKMGQLLDEVLELSRIGRMFNPPSETPMRELVDEAIELLAGGIAERGVKISISPDLPVLYGDRPRLLEVLQNLIENAVKFMGDQPNPEIKIGVREEDRELVLYVRDNGIGIDPQYHDRIFRLFDKLDRKTEGTGIGLALVKRIIEVHNGQIWVETDGMGKGCTFCFTLPGTVEVSEGGKRT